MNQVSLISLNCVETSGLPRGPRYFQRPAGRELNVPDICASFTAAVVDVQVAKARMALRETA